MMSRLAAASDYAEALPALLGPDARGLSPDVIVRLKEKWGQEYRDWSRRDLSGEESIYVWADGIHVNVRLEDESNKKQCLLVLMGATAEGRKELIAVMDGLRESKQNWQELLLDLQQRGLSKQPKLAVGHGALGFWAALREVYPTTREQPLEGSECPPGLIRLPDGALGATCGQPTHREYLRDDRPPAWPHERQQLSEGYHHHDIQARPVSQPTLAKTQRASPNCSRS
jgi:Transposase, Mutator family